MKKIEVKIIIFVLTRPLAGLALVEAVSAAPLLEPAIARGRPRHGREGLDPHVGQNSSNFEYFCFTKLRRIQFDVNRTEE